MTKLNSARLTAYSAFGATFLITINQAQAQVIYSDIEPDFEIDFGDIFIGHDEITYQMDLNHDGLMDVSFYVYSYASNKVIYNSRYVSFNLQLPDGNSFVSDKVTTESAMGPAKLEGGVEVGFKNDWEDAHSSTMMYGSWSRDVFEVYNSSSGNWKTAENKFVGVKFMINDKPHYGWIRLSVEKYAGKKPKGVITIKDFAYESKAGTPIVTPITLEKSGNPLLSVNDKDALNIDFITPGKVNGIDEYRIFLMSAKEIASLDTRQLVNNDNYTSVTTKQINTEIRKELKNIDWQGDPILAGQEYVAVVLSYNSSFAYIDLQLSDASNIASVELNQNTIADDISELNVYATGKTVHINTNDINYEGAIVNVYSMNGEKVADMIISGTTNEQDLNCAKGSYIITIQKGDDSISRKVEITE